MRAFVTGGTGFAGGALCRLLKEERHEVVALARPASDVRALKALGVTLVIGDVRDPGSLGRGMRGCEVVYHLAAAFREAKLAGEEFHGVNVEGTENVVRAAAAAGVARVVHASTIGVVGDTGATPAEETRGFYAARDSYNRTKIAGEECARALFEELALEGVVARPGAGYGPGELRYLKLFKGVAKGRFVLFGAGETVYNLGYIDDLCAGLILCGTHPRAGGEVFNLGGAENVTLNTLVSEVACAVDCAGAAVRHVPLWPLLTAARVVETVCKPFGVEPPLHRRRAEFFTVHRALSIEKARSLLGYRPRVSLKQGLRMTADWYRSQGLL